MRRLGAAPGAVAVDLAVLGQGAVLQGSGEVAVLTFRQRAPGAAPSLRTADLRDRGNHFLGDVPAGAVRSDLAQGDARKSLRSSAQDTAQNTAQDNSQNNQQTDAQNEATSASLQPGEIKFLAARPNPFSGSTQLSFRLPAEMAVRIEIHDVVGRLIQTVFNGMLAAGEHSMIWDGRNDAGGKAGIGVYLCTFQAGNVRQTRKLFRYR